MNIRPRKATKIMFMGRTIYAFFEGYYGFSNWFKCKFYADGIWWNSSEQRYMWLKSCYFNDNEIAELILKSNNPGRQKYLGRRIKNFDRKKWEEVCESVIKNKLNLIKLFLRKCILLFYQSSCKTLRFWICY